MAIAQDAFYIPDDIATGLATGLYTLNSEYLQN